MLSCLHKNFTAMDKHAKKSTTEEIRINKTEIIGTIALQYLQSIKLKMASR